MEALQQSLDALQRESKELIAACCDAMVAAVEKAAVPPGRVAVTFAKRFTVERIPSSFPALCLADYIVGAVGRSRQSPPGQADGNDALSPRAAAVLEAIMTDFWKLAPPLFAHYATQDDLLRNKTLRVLRRWKQRNLLPLPIATALVGAVESGPAAVHAEEENARTGDGTARAALGNDSSSSSAMEAKREKAPPVGLSHAQARAFAAVLRRCSTALEQLPPARAQPYVVLIRKEHLTRPTAAALAFFQDLLAELQQRERPSAPHDASSSGRAAEASAGQPPSQDTSGNRAALGRLLDALSASAGDEDGGIGDAKSGSGGGAGTVGVTRYTSALLSDVGQQRPLTERAGVGTFSRRRAAATAAGGAGLKGDYYYPRKDASARRPFRIPAARMQGGAVRAWCPTPREWLAEKDMASLALFESREDAHAMGEGGSRKRTRE